MNIEYRKQDYALLIKQLAKEIVECDAIVVGVGSGLSTAAGFTYSGERFEKYFSDFITKYHLTDMYSASFYPFSTLEEHWTFWARMIYYNRYIEAPKDTYQMLLKLIQDKDYFVLTTNEDHQFKKAGFLKERLFYTQGDYGLWQCSKPFHSQTYDNEEAVKEMLARQQDMKIPTELIPYCPQCGAPMVMNLRCDEKFVEDDGWYQARSNYEAFLSQHQRDKVLFLELGVGRNTPGIIKYPFWNLTDKNPNAKYVCINTHDILCLRDIYERSILINADIDQALGDVLYQKEKSR